MSDPKTLDDLDAVRTIVETLKHFKQEEQQRILRWVSEKTGLFLNVPATVPPAGHSSSGAPPLPTQNATKPDSLQTAKQDLRSFVEQKSPRSDVQFAATVAYYLRFEAPASEKKEYVTKEDLQEACRKANRGRLINPYQTLMNAHNMGLVDKGPEKATFVINTVGENLVAMSLPDNGASGSKQKVAKKSARPVAKKVKKSAAKKAGKS
jgi:hypothetical protein